MRSLAILMLAIGLSGQLHAQSGMFDNIVLDGGPSGGAGTPFLNMSNANRNQFITAFPDNLGFFVNESYKFQINESANEDGLVLNETGAVLKERLQVEHSRFETPLRLRNLTTGDIFRIGPVDIDFNLGVGLGFDGIGNFVIENDAKSASMYLSDLGLGVGAKQNVDAPLHVLGGGSGNSGFAEARVLVENVSQTTAVRDMFELVNNGGSRDSRFTDTSIASQWSFSSNGSGSFAVSRGSTGGTEMLIASNGRVLMGPGGLNNFDLRANGNLIIRGTLSQSSDKNMKTAFRDVSDRDVLSKVVAMPVQTWQFKHDDADLRHLGPTAQDFHAAFGLGENEKTIAPVDGIGVALVAIKALNEELESKAEQIEDLKDEVQTLNETVAAQTKMLMMLEERLRRAGL